MIKNMKCFTGWQWLLIDAANQFGHDKLRFEERIAWTEAHLYDLEQLIDQAPKKTRPLFAKAVYAIRKAQQGKATGHVVGLDATCSGIQVMSVLTGCVDGARATGLVDPDRRADAYTDCTNEMTKILGSQIIVDRADAKRALMTSFYGSKQEPKNIFGEDTKELKAFYKAAITIAPGAWELLQDLLNSWQPFALYHEWKMPDGFDARVKVMNKRSARIEVAELGGASFTYEYYDNIGQKKGLSNVANVTHSVDAYILRCMHRRCNYDLDVVTKAARLIQIELIERSLGTQRSHCKPAKQAGYYWEQYQRSSVADVVILPHLDNEAVKCLDTEHLKSLSKICHGMLQYKPFPIVSVHDEFKCHPNNVNWMRWQYREILAEIADSNLLDDILSQLHNMPVQFNKLSFNLGDRIRKSNYALC